MPPHPYHSDLPRSWDGMSARECCVDDTTYVVVVWQWVATVMEKLVPAFCLHAGRGKKPELTLFIPNPADEEPIPAAQQNVVQIHVHKASVHVSCTWANTGPGALNWCLPWCVPVVVIVVIVVIVQWTSHACTLCWAVSSHAHPSFPPAHTHTHSSTSPPCCLQDLLSPAEVRYVEELNGMDIPLNIVVENEPPMSTSRRAAQDALDALITSPAGLGPLSLNGPFSSSNSLASGFDDILRWFQTGLTPRSTRGGASILRTPKGLQGAGKAGTDAGAAAQASPGRLTRSMARGGTPRGQAAPLQPQPQPSQGGTPRKQGSRGRDSASTILDPADLVAQESVLHDGHRQLINKLLVTHKNEVEDIVCKLSTPRSPPKEQGIPPATAPGSGSRPRTRSTASAQQQQDSGAGGLSGSASRPSPHPMPSPQNGSLSQPSSTRITRRSAALQTPGTNSNAPDVGSQPGSHPGLTGGLTLNTQCPLPSPGFNALGFGPPSSTRDAWKNLDVLVTPHFTPQEIQMLLDVLDMNGEA